MVWDGALGIWHSFKASFKEPQNFLPKSRVTLKCNNQLYGPKSRKFGLAPSANLVSRGGRTTCLFKLLKSGHLITGLLSIYKFNNKKIHRARSPPQRGLGFSLWSELRHLYVGFVVTFPCNQFGGEGWWWWWWYNTHALLSLRRAFLGKRSSNSLYPRLICT